MKRFGLFLMAMLLLASCVKKEENVAPKPRGFFRIDLPEHAYQKLDTVLPFTFDYSQHAVCTFVAKDKEFVLREHLRFNQSSLFVMNAFPLLTFLFNLKSLTCLMN